MIYKANTPGPPEQPRNLNKAIGDSSDAANGLAESLTNERKNQHGDWAHQSEVAQKLKSVVKEAAFVQEVTKEGRHLNTMQREALEMICTKISRICCGDPNHKDHWDDIAGYAFLGKGGHKK